MINPDLFFQRVDPYSKLRPLREAAKKSSSTSSKATKALNPHLELSGHRNFFFSF